MQIYNRSTTQFVATKRIAFQPGRGLIGEKAEIAARTSSQPERIVANRGGILGRAIERRAMIRAAQSREQARQVVQIKAEVKIREAFDGLLEARLAEVNWLAQQRYLMAVILGRQRYDCWTSGGWLNIAVSSAEYSSSDSSSLEMKHRSHGTLGRNEPRIQVWVHQRVLGKRFSMLLLQVDLARELLSRLVVAMQAFANPEVAL